MNYFATGDFSGSESTATDNSAARKSAAGATRQKWYAAACRFRPRDAGRKIRENQNEKCGKCVRGYDKNTALAIPKEVMKKLKIEHPKVTGAQSSLYSAFAKTGRSLTWKKIEEIETKALIRGGANADQALVTVREVIKELKNSGIKPKRIPWGG